MTKGDSMKRFFVLSGYTACCLMISSCGAVKDFKEFKKKVGEIKVNSVDFKTVADGEYTGSYDLKFVSAYVNVKVEQGVVKDIKLNKHGHGPGYSGEKIIPRIIEKQSLDVDAIAKATNSCKVIEKAIEIALTKGIIPASDSTVMDSAGIKQ